ncbi:MAG TPA: hypothetical protein VLN49_07270 [Gemmatimonadaceae bacterium]|nr:hypothetical protein [Gemmatimonadaceae bacterium]
MIHTTDDCGIATALAQGWLDEVVALSDSTHIAIDAKWIVFGSASKLRSLFRLADGAVPSVELVSGGERAMDEYTGLHGSPFTIVVNPSDSVASLNGGNWVPDTSQIRRWCAGAVSRNAQ